MVLVRLVFQAKFGHAGELVAAFRQGAEAMAGSAMRPRHVRILTDLSGPFDTIVEELEFDCLEDYINGQAAVFADPAFREMMQQTVGQMEGGSKEYYTIEYAQ